MSSERSSLVLSEDCCGGSSSEEEDPLSSSPTTSDRLNGCHENHHHHHHPNFISNHRPQHEPISAASLISLRDEIRRSNSYTAMLRRLLIRPVAIIALGFCIILIQGTAWNENGSTSTTDDSSSSWSIHHSSESTLSSPASQLLDQEMVALPSASSNSLFGPSSEQPQQQTKGLWNLGKSKPKKDDNADDASVDEPSPSGDSQQHQYGWEPLSYPDPLLDPTRCGIAYLPETNRTRLRLCDPDWALGGLYLEQLALALSNFTMWLGDLRQTEERYWNRDRKLESSSVWEEEGKNMVFDSPPNISGHRHLRQLHTKEETDDEFTLEASSEDQSESQSHTAHSREGPIVELGIAVVHSVSVPVLGS